MLKRKFKFLLMASVSILFVTNACKNERNPSITSKIKLDTIVEPKIEKVTFLIENSESMFGYVNGFTEYVDVLTELSQKPQFAKEKTPREFNFINGGEELEITPIGNNPTDLKDKLNTIGYNCGDVTKSNLNAMFQDALSRASGDSISILISDGIYDVSDSPEPLNVIANLGLATRTKFIEKLNTTDIQTIMIKLNSDFDGYYFFISQNGRIKLNQKRPYYIWIFGESNLLNKYFPESYISEKLNGYNSMIRFLKIGKSQIPHQATTYNRKGSFKFNSTNKNILEDAVPDNKTKEFRFSIAVDFSSLPFSDIYINSIGNYDINDNFKINSIEEINKIPKKIFGLNFEPTHMITVSTNKNPYGKLQVSLKNTIPDWINETNIDNDIEIENNVNQTIGFSHLTQGITGAYQEFATNKGIITTFNIEIKK